MRFMIIRKADAETEAGVMPSAELVADMMAYNEQMIRAGVMVAGDGLRPSRDGARISFKDGKPTIVDGPFAEAKELIAGYTMIQVRDKDEALEWVRRWPAIDGHGNVQLELRRLYETDDFGDAVTPEIRKQEELLRGLAAKNAKGG